MIWQTDLDGVPVSQGDIFSNCPLLMREDEEFADNRRLAERPMRVIALTQACDIAQGKTSRVVVAVVHEAQQLVDAGILKTAMIRDQIRTHRVYGWYFLPVGSGLPESLVDLHHLHTVPRRLLDELIANGQRVARLLTPYREHVAQHFATTYARIALPEPYETQP